MISKNNSVRCRIFPGQVFDGRSKPCDHIRWLPTFVVAQYSVTPFNKMFDHRVGNKENESNIGIQRSL